MKSINRLIISSFMLSLIFASPGYTDDGDPDPNNDAQNIATYLNNLGAFLGYDLSKGPQSTPPSPVVPATNTQILNSGMFSNLFNTFFGSTPVNMIYDNFVPNSSPLSSANGIPNVTAFSGASGGQGVGALAINPVIDQKPNQPDAVSQAILNILGTPDFTFCMDPTGQNWTGVLPGATGVTNAQFPDCTAQYDTKVVTDILGPLPAPKDLFSPQYNQQFISQLNINNLIAPLMYSNTPNPNTPPSQNTTNTGLPAQTQVDLASAFIRYATGSVAPVPLANQSDYTSMYTKASGLAQNVTPVQQAQAQAALATYLAKLRIYAAQSSVAYSNLYYIFSRRVPQSSSTSSSPSSQALNEFNMSSWRLFSPSSDPSKPADPNTQWLNMINNAPTATVQKEIAILLAEINYQLYLTRQQQERLLLTNTMMLIFSATGSGPKSSDLSPNQPLDS